MGLASMILGILSVSICWLPGIGWLGVALGAISCVLGVLATSRSRPGTGAVGFAISGLCIDVVGVPVGLAFQIKHAGGALDMLFRPLPLPEAYCAIGVLALLVGLGLALAKFKARFLGDLLALLALAGLLLVGGWTLITADRQMTFDGEDPSAASNL